jgi:hypothetical protein
MWGSAATIPPMVQAFDRHWRLHGWRSAQSALVSAFHADCALILMELNDVRNNRICG